MIELDLELQHIATIDMKLYEFLMIELKLAIL